MTLRPQRLEILKALDRLEANSNLVSSKTLPKILRYIIGEELNGRGERIKALSIAWDALGKPKDFNPQQDPVVRVNFSRLRRSLIDYYENDGHDDPIIISIPKGAYRPVFLYRNASKSLDIDTHAKSIALDVETSIATDRQPIKVNNQVSSKLKSTVFTLTVFVGIVFGSYSLLNQGAVVDDEAVTARPVLHVLPFEAFSKSIDPILIEALRRNITADLSDYKNLSVRLHTLESAAQHELSIIDKDVNTKTALGAKANFGISTTLSKSKMKPDQNYGVYQLSAIAHEYQNKTHVLLVLSVATSREVVWSHDFNFKSNQMPSEHSIHAEVELIANSIAGEQGVVARGEYQRFNQQRGVHPEHNISHYQCLLVYQEWDQNRVEPLEARARECLVGIINDGCNVSSIWSARSSMQLFDWSRSDGRSPVLYDEALFSARRAVELDAHDFKAFQNLGVVLMDGNDLIGARYALKTAMSLNSSDPDASALLKLLDAEDNARSSE